MMKSIPYFQFFSLGRVKSVIHLLM